MDSRDWMILKTINEELSLTKAAERLYISQPSLTYRLHKLEKEFEVTILNRFSDGVSFTYQGECILKYAEKMLEELKLLKDHVQKMKEPICGTLKLGISTVFAKYKLAPILKTYQNRFPDVKISLKTGSSTLQLPDMLNKNTVDIIIIREAIDWSEKKHVILEEQYGIISSYPIKFDQLTSIPWIQYDLPFDDDTFHQWWNKQFSYPLSTNVIHVNSIEASIEMVSQGLGWAMIPKIHIENRRSMFFYPLIHSDGQPISLETLMLYRNKALDKPAVKVFVDYVLNNC